MPWIINITYVIGHLKGITTNCSIGIKRQTIAATNRFTADDLGVFVLKKSLNISFDFFIFRPISMAMEFRVSDRTEFQIFLSYLSSSRLGRHSEATI